MYNVLLVIHSMVRWLVLISLTVAVYRSFMGWRQNRVFTKNDNRARHITATLAHVQWTVGMTLYFFSPIVHYFYKNFTEAVHQREVRFFGMEHITMMALSIIALTIVSIKVKRIEDDNRKFKTMFIGYSIVLLVVFLSIPWSFSPFTSRPLFRW